MTDAVLVLLLDCDVAFILNGNGEMKVVYVFW
jgi:hypothetical protein